MEGDSWQFDSLIRRRAADARTLTNVDEEDAVRQRSERMRVAWDAINADILAASQMIDEQQRKADLIAQLDERVVQFGEKVEIVPLSDEEAAILGLQPPTLRMRVAAFLTRLCGFVRVWP